jgi:hypothetical protein
VEGWKVGALLKALAAFCMADLLSLCRLRTYCRLLYPVLGRPTRVTTAAISYCAEHRWMRSSFSINRSSPPIFLVSLPHLGIEIVMGWSSGQQTAGLPFHLTKCSCRLVAIYYLHNSWSITDHGIPAKMAMILECYRFGSRSCRHDWLSPTPHQVRQAPESPI